MQTPSAEGSLWDSFTLPITEHPDPARDLLFLEAHPDPKSITEARKGVIVALRGMGVTLEREGEQGLSASFAQPKTNDRALVIDTLSDLSSLNTAFSLSMAGVDNLKSYFDHLKMYYEKLMADGETDRAFRLIAVTGPRDVLRINRSDRRHGVLTEEHQEMMDEFLVFCEREIERPEHEECAAISHAVVEAHLAQLSQTNQFQSLQ